MIAEIAHRRPEVAALCERYHVRRLDVFGSAARGTDFGPAFDVDVLVAYEPAHAPPSLGDSWPCATRWPRCSGAMWNLIMDGVVRNP
ncbi:MAG: nucleotidyltransferase domain-containing protein [Rhodospirillales bacterium]